MTLSWAISGHSSAFANSPHCSISWTWEWQSGNVLPTFSFMCLHLGCLTAIKCQSHLLHKANSYDMLSFSRRKSVFVITGASPASWGSSGISPPPEPTFENLSAFRISPLSPQESECRPDLASITQRPGLGWCSKIHTIKWGSSCKVNYTFLKEPTEITIMARANVE